MKKNEQQYDSSSTFGLQTQNQIECQFNKLTQLYRQQQQTPVPRARSLSESKSQQKARPSLSVHSNVIASDDSLRGQIKVCFEKSLKETSHALICRKLGTKLIGSTMQGLILYAIQKVKSITAAQIETEYFGVKDFIANKNILKQFDIPQEKINLQKKTEDKIKFVLDSMKSNIDSHMDTLTKQLQEAQKQQMKFDASFKQRVDENENENRKTKLLSEQSLCHSRFNAIKGKLWQAIVSKLGEYENQILCHKAIESNSKVSKLVNFKGVSTVDVIRSEMASNRRGNSFHRSELNKFSGSLSPLPQNGIVVLSQEQSWNIQKEQKYQDKFRKTKSSYHIDNRSLIAIGLQENIYEKIKQEDGRKERDHLFKKYIDEGLTADEVKFLNDTCDLINSNIDKEFEKRKLKVLDQELINQIELKVVQELLQRFAMLRSEFMKARQSYILKKNDITTHRISQYELLRNEAQALQARKAWIVRKKDLFMHKVDRMEDGLKFENPNVKIYVKMFIEGMKRNVKTKQAQRQEIEQIKFLRRDQVELRKTQVNFVSSTATPAYVENWDQYFNKKKMKDDKTASVEFRLKKASFHPPSKLMIFYHDDAKEDKEAAKLRFTAQLRKAKLYYEISYDQDKRFKQKTKFAAFYTGGPIQPAHKYDFDKKGESTPHANRCAILIQKVYKSYMVRKNFKNQLNKREEDLRDGVYKIVDNIQRKKWEEILKDEQARNYHQRKRKNLLGQRDTRFRNKSLHQQPTDHNQQPTQHPMEIKKHFKISSKLRTEGSTTEYDNNNLQKRNVSLQRLQALSGNRTRMNSSQHSMDRTRVTDMTENKNLSQANISNSIIIDDTKNKRRELLNILASKADADEKQIHKLYADKLQERQLLVIKLRTLFRMAKQYKNEENYVNSNTSRVSPAEVNLLDRSGHSALYYACLRGCVPVVKFILNELKGDINQKCHSNQTPLHAAMSTNNHELIFYLASQPHTDFNTLNDEGLTPLGLCSAAVLMMLGVFDRVVVSVNDKNMKINFDNNKVMMGSVIEHSQPIEALIFKQKTPFRGPIDQSKNNTVSFKG